MATSSAPGKIILFGEHAVVYGHPALAVPVTQVQATATVSKASRLGIWIEAPDIGLHSELSHLAPNHPLAAVTRGVFSALGVNSPLPLTIHISSSIPVASGLGSGAAVSVAIIRALSTFLQASLSDDQVSALAYEIEKLHHGTPSGIDNTVITYSKPVYFIKGQPVKAFHAGAPFTIIIGDTGVSAPTRESVGDVRRLWEADQPRWERLFDEIGKIVEQAKSSIEKGKTDALGELMNRNHILLQELTISSPELDLLVGAARGSGALGAKLSGGGRGGNMIALVRSGQAEQVAAALEAAGAKRVLTTTIQPE
jgi:mevalonate kinase